MSNVEEPSILRRAVGLVGHGDPGVITAGCGRRRDLEREDNILKLTNPSDWAPELQRLGGMPDYLVLVSCSTGKGPQGRSFLRAVACAAGATAVAPTTQLYTLTSGKIWLHWNGEWQYSTCDGSEWRHPGGMLSRLRHRIITGLRGAQIERSSLARQLGEIQGARYTPIARDEGSVLEFDRTEALDLLSSVDRIPEIVPTGAAPLSVPTGYLEFLLLGEDRDETRRFTVFGSSALRDDEHPNLFYETDEAFLDKLGGWEQIVEGTLPEIS